MTESMHHGKHNIDVTTRPTIPDHFFTMPETAHTTVSFRQLREMLLAHEGTIIARGRLWDISHSHLGAGVYRVFLVARNDESATRILQKNQESEIVSKLPITRDGVRVIPMWNSVWAVIDGQIEECNIVAYEQNRGWIAKTFAWDKDVNVSVTNCFSSKDAAVAAQKRK